MNDIASYSLCIAILVMMSAYFSASETAFSSLNTTKIKAMIEKGNHRAALTLSLAEQYDKLISSILIGNNIVNIAAASIGTVLFVKIYGDLGATISTVVLTIVVLIFGEVSPKSIAKDCPEQFAMFSAPFLKVLIWVLTPVNFLFTCWKKLLTKIFKLEPDRKMSQEELLMLVEEVQQEGSIDQNEGNLLKNAIEFTEQEAEDILTHRVDLEAVSLDSTKEEIANVFSETKFSRILVYDEDIDHVVGVIHQKDFYTGGGISPLPISEIMTAPIFVLKSEKISNVLRQLQREKSHIAVVLDEYGGTAGIITMEDILEELVGEIWDEHDEVTIQLQQIGKNVYRVDASMDLDDFCEHFSIKTDSEMTSLGSWVMEQLEKVPDEGDTMDYGPLHIRVLSVESHRIMFVEVTVAEDTGTQEEIA